MRLRFFLLPVLAALAAPALAQLGLPQVQLPPTAGVLRDVTGAVAPLSRDALRAADRLARDRIETIDRLVRKNRETIEFDARGDPARRGELLVMDADAAAMRRLGSAGFAILANEELGELGLTVTRLAVPRGMTLAEAEATLAMLTPDATITPDHLHFTSGTSGGAHLAVAAPASISPARVPVGMIDGAPGESVAVASRKGFAKGAPYPSNHGSAVASLLQQAGVRTIHVADVYGTDPAGGNALAIAKGLGWLAGQGSRVVTISLVGPRNPVLERAIGAARGKGVVVVAAVGNDGPAAPPAYPASYSGVVAVTAVDRRKRALIEAGRALHLDYAAPGADIRGLNAKGKAVKLRGTSFAAPLVAARAAHALAHGANWRSALDSEAEDLGRKGADEVYGRGLLCANCGRD